MDCEDTTSPAEAPRRGRGERGANLVEYAMLVALIALVCVAGVMQFGTKVSNTGWQSVSAAI
jgi:Flp pilus assembly pilin Flp